MNTANRRPGGVLIGVGGLGAALALLCCAAPWILCGGHWPHLASASFLKTPYC